QVLFEALVAVLAPDTTHLVAAERRVGAVIHTAVDHHRAGTDAARDSHGPLGGAHDGAGEAVAGVVGQLDGGVVAAVVRRDGKDRSEDLFLEDRVSRFDVGYDRRRYEVATVQPIGHSPADGDTATVALGDLDVVEHPVPLLGRHQRPAECVRIR